MPDVTKRGGVLGGGPLEGVALVHCSAGVVVVPVTRAVSVIVAVAVVAVVVVLVEAGGADEGLEVVLLAADEPGQLALVLRPPT